MNCNPWVTHLLLNAMLMYLCIGLVNLSASSGFAQEPNLADLQQQWAQIESQFSAKQAAIKSGEGNLKELRDEYLDLVDQAHSLIRKIKFAALEKLNESPNDLAAIRAVMGLLLNDAENGRDKEVLDVGDRLITGGIDPRYFKVAATADRLEIPAREIFDELLVRQQESADDNLPRVRLTTTEGDILLELYENQAPNTVANFISLVESEFYSNLLFHRVIEGKFAQTGEFKSDNDHRGQTGYSIACECYEPEARPHFSHCVSMAHTGKKDTGSSQFFLTFSRTHQLDGRHTCFGRVISGGDVLDKIERTHIAINNIEQPIPNVEKDKIISATVIRKREHEYQPKKINAPDSQADSDTPKTSVEPNPEEPAPRTEKANPDQTQSEVP
jgi:cyclophilin family peptidyl-prolyl cis-trans isomerase